MDWVKRNLFFVVGGLVAAVLLGASGFYIYQGWSLNSAKAAKLDEFYDTLKKLSDQKPSPGNNKINNTDIAREQEKQIRDWIQSVGKYFQPVPAIPPGGNVDDRGFADALRQTVAQLQSEAGNASVTLPPQYDFSFAAQQQLMRFASGSPGQLAVQLGAIKAISEIIFAARVNSFDGIQRTRVSADDAAGPAANYTSETPVTNDLAVITPYVVTFRSFTPELARVISAFATSSNAFIVKSINVQPASAAAGAIAPGDVSPGAAPGTPPWMSERRGMPMPPAVARPVVQKNGLQTILKEQLLRITIEVDVVNLLTKTKG